MKTILNLLLVLILTVSCQSDQESSIITKTQDYNTYLNIDTKERIISLNKKITELEQIVDEDSTRYINMSRLATTHEAYFNLTGDVTHLNAAVSLREKAAQIAAIKKENYLYSLAQAYIKQHKFKAANGVIEQAAKLTQDNSLKLVQFDIAMELGDYEKAERLLGEFKNSNDYNYLIRAAKWNDHKGDLNSTIQLMEEALVLADKSGNPALQQWSYSNIADYYGHDGQVEKSYNYYLKTLKSDPNSSYALKGIAWIAYAHDNNPEEAIRIMHNILETKRTPDYYLLLSELYEYSNEPKESEKMKEKFLYAASKPAYGDMYNAYLIEQLSLGDSSQKEQALSIARLEVANRATPETYDLLSFALLQNNNVSEASETFSTYVKGKTYEPVAQLHEAMIMKALGKNEELTSLKKELAEASYELGPVTSKEIKEL